jgi:hypothetical protein
MYSLKKGIWKALGAILTGAIALAGLSLTPILDVPLTALVTEHLFPVIGGLTSIGVIKWAHNLVKFKNKED